MGADREISSVRYSHPELCTDKIHKRTRKRHALLHRSPSSCAVGKRVGEGKRLWRQYTFLKRTKKKGEGKMVESLNSFSLATEEEQLQVGAFGSPTAMGTEDSESKVKKNTVRKSWRRARSVSHLPAHQKKGWTNDSFKREASTPFEFHRVE